MHRTKRLIVGLAVAGVLAIQSGTSVRAHNAGHVDLPTGECQNVGSGKSVTPESEHNPLTNAAGEIDQNPAIDGDQIGASNAGERGNSAVDRRHCS